jgi:choline dehydrogenase
MRATSRGYIKLRTSNPREHPIIDPKYLETEQDKLDMRAAVRLTREIFEQHAFDEYRADAISPAQHIQSDEEIDAWVRAHSESAYHPSCTCRMGTDENTVVGPDTKVHGIDNLRVVDASIMPNIISGNLNAPTIMIAEKAADIILGKEPLMKSTAPVYQAKNWEISQR